MSLSYHLCAAQPSGQHLCKVTLSASRKCHFPIQHHHTNLWANPMAKGCHCSIQWSQGYRALNDTHSPPCWL